MKRNPALDLTRCFALFCVVSVHFFSNTEVLTLSMNNWDGYLICLLRSFFMIAVSLFLLLSGYLMGSRTPTKQYYRKLGQTLWIYLLASLCCGAYQMYASIVYWGAPASPWDLVLGIFAFQTAPYGWYVGMYIGLFLLIPYLNILYHQLTKKQKQYLIAILLFLTAVPGVANIHNLSDLSWWLLPSRSDVAHELVSPWWVDMFPITYYFIGVYLREYPLKMKQTTNLLWIIVLFLVLGSYTFYRSYPGVYQDGFWMGYGSLLNVIQSVLVFHFLSHLPLNRLPGIAQAALSQLSSWCLGAYLVSWIFDQHFYSALRDEVPDISQRIDHFLPSVIKIYLLSLLVSGGLNLASQIGRKLLLPVKKQSV